MVKYNQTERKALENAKIRKFLEVKNNDKSD